LRNLLEVHMYLNDCVRNSTITAGMMWAWPIW